MSEEGPSGGNCKEEEDATITLLRHLRLALKTEPPPRLSLEECVANSEAFPITFPINTARMSRLVKADHTKEQLESHINETYPVIHERLLPLMAFFLRHKNGFGRRKEKCIYSKMDLLELVDRFLLKRPVVFINPSDSYLALDGTSGAGSFEDIGHSHESSRMPMENFISYDEMKFSALMVVSSPTFFINDGSRRNRGLPGAPGSYCPQGIIIGAVGARFEKEMLMEYQDCVIAEEQNTKEKGYGLDAPPRKRLQQEWGRLWTGRPLLHWEEVKERMSEEDLAALHSKAWFNNRVYSKRIQMTAEVILAEANTRARAMGLKAYLHVVGLGLGVWCILNQQETLFVDAWGEAISATDTSHIAHIDFSWISATSCKGVTDGQVFPNTDIVIHFSKRSLHAPIPEGTLLVCTYAWDSNALPGNEYWHGRLSSTGDPAAACSSQIAELHNPHINTTLRGAGLRVATPSGVVPIQEYARAYIDAREQSTHKS